MRKSCIFVFISIILTISFYGSALKAEPVERTTEEAYMKRIRKCENIAKPKKKKRCQERFLEYFNSLDTNRGTIILKLDPREWEWVLRYITENDRSIDLRMIAYDHLNDQDGLVNIVLSDHVPYGRSRPIWNRTGLMKIGSSTKDKAFRLIKGEKYFKKIFNQSKIDYLRDWALSHIHDQDFLIDLIKREKSGTIRNSALKNLDDRETLENLALNDPDWRTRSIAVQKIEDQELLQRLIKNDKDVDVQRNAAMNIDPDRSRDFLDSLVEHPNRHVRRIARLKLIISDPEIRKIHGKLELQYEPSLRSKTYGQKGDYRIYSVKREVVGIIITEKTGKVLFKEFYWGRSAQKQEIFKKKKGSKLLEARIDFEAIKRKLLEQPGGNQQEKIP